MPGSVEAFEVFTEDDIPHDHVLIDEKAEEDMSEAQLREAYDDEEVDRFLHLFSTYVSEVKAPSHSPAPSEEIDATGIRADTNTSSRIGAGTDKNTLSGWVAARLLPYLPPPNPPPAAFSIKRFRLAIQRIYMAVEPTYLPLAIRLYKLAAWKDYNTSLAYCVLYWILWWNGALLAGLIGQILFSLFRRRFLPHPTLAELRQRRSEADRAEDFSLALTMRLAGSPSLGIREAYHIYRDFQRSWKKAKSSSHVGSPQVGEEGGDEASIDPTVQSVQPDTPEERALAAQLLYMMNLIADLHERIRNIFLWRKPSVSTEFGAILIGLFIFALLPAVYIVRICGLVLGIMFWHVVPIIVALPPEDRSRLSLLLDSAPTDSEYAMEIISQRVARGLPIKPKHRRPKRRDPSEESERTTENAQPASTTEIIRDHLLGERSVDWKKWGERAADAKAWTQNVKGSLQGGKWKSINTWRSLSPLSTEVAVPRRGIEPRVETHTFPAQYNKGVGLITLTPTTLYYTLLSSTQSQLVIELKDVTAVQKTSHFNGIRIKWNSTSEDGAVEEKEAKFTWVGSRDELFARLVGWQGRRWIGST
ncbi:hypothetical protein K474DRAFT_1598700 [Panus rudis PR-1116 ss-1]|nr:hypothetical protein K474DRAFT_1598700 [Panus rudis PR-1116 ss-1]